MFAIYIINYENILLFIYLINIFYFMYKLISSLKLSIFILYKS
jgi:hypothetical protein